MPLHHVADLAELEEAKAKIVSIRGRSIGIVKSQGKIYAIRNVCPHKGAPVCRGQIRGTFLASRPDEFVFGLDGQVLQCPWHGWEFNLETGAQMCGTEDKLITYPVTVQDQSVYLDFK
jgi:nitrite reductase (NADH) small subunit